METPLTPLDFLRRAGKLYGGRLAVVDGECRLTYAQFRERCDRWTAGLAALGVGKGDRVATISPNTHQHLEQFYAIPQRGAVIVPMNYRLAADDFVYMTAHSGAKVICVHPDYLDLIDAARARMPTVKHFIALEGEKTGWLPYEALLKERSAAIDVNEIVETDLLAINYTSGTTSRPKGVMITHRNAWVNSIGTLTHWPMTPADRYLWTLPMFHANGWTFTWTVTAAGAAHICLRRVDAPNIYEHINRERVTPPMCGANGADRDGERAGRAAGGIAARPQSIHRRCPAGGRDHRTVGDRTGMGGHACLRTHRDRAFHIDLRAVARACGTLRRRPCDAQGSPGRRARHVGRIESGR